MLADIISRTAPHWRCYAIIPLAMADVLVRNVPDCVVQSLKQRASKNQRSLQQECLRILQTAATQAELPDPFELADRIRARLTATGRTFGDSVDLLREDRER